MKVLVAMSGGVDSSAAAMILKNKGIEVIGAMMNLLNGNSQEIDQAKAVAKKMDIPFHVFDLKNEFNCSVINNFIKSYEKGETPNPCIDCNKHLKFGAFFHEAEKLGCTHIATGHYARIEKKGDKYLLKKAKDIKKDQSYVLYSLTQDKLSKVIFPLGDMSKEETRLFAKENEMTNANKKDSQDICFVPDGDYVKVIKELTGNIYPKGNFVDMEGNILGEHKGIIGYTIGQRKGLGLALPKPMFVCEKRIAENEVVLCYSEELYKKEMYVKNVNWTLEEIKEPIKAKVKIRYNQEGQSALITPFEKGVKVNFDEPQRAISLGQAAVFYDDDLVLGGGTITKMEEIL